MTVGALVESTGAVGNAATITIMGTGTDEGVDISGNAIVRSANGAVGITGINNDTTGDENIGVHVLNGGVVQSTAAATVTVSGTGGAGNTTGDGVRVGLRYPDGEIRTSLWRSFVEGQPNDDQVPLTEDHLREATPARLVDPVPAGGYALELRWGTGPVVVQPVRITPGARTPIRVTLDR